MGTLKRHVWGILAAALVFAAYAPSLRYVLLFDDAMLISGNPNLTWDRGGVRVTSPFWRIQLDQVPEGKQHLGGMYRPVISLLNLVDKSLAGGKAWPFHLTNVLGHAASTALVYLLFLRFLPRPWQAGLLALAWGLNPLHTEVVAFVSGRTDLFSTLFMLAALLVYLRGSSAALFGVFLLLALGSKETSICLLPLIGLWHLARPMPVRRAHWLVGGGVLVAFAIVRSTALAGGHDNLPHGLEQAWATASLLPSLAVQHLCAVAIPWGAWSVAPKISHDTTLLTIEWTAFAWMVLKSSRDRVLALGLGWVLLFFLPTAFGALHVYAGVDDLISKRFMSFASIGFWLWIGHYVFTEEAPSEAPSSPELPSRSLIAATAVYLLAFGVQTVRRSEVYLDEHHFWATLAQESPDSDMVAYNYGLQLLAEGNCQASMVETRRSIAINPRYFQGSAFLNLSACLRGAGRIDEARKTLDEGLRYFPQNPRLASSRAALEPR
jgi:hypothetical protein